MKRMKRWGLWCLVGMICATAAPVAAQLQLVPFIPGGLSSPVQMVQDPTTPTVQYVVEQGGKIKVIKNGAIDPTPFLDLTSAVLFNGERGLLSMAFAPDYASSGRVYIYFINPDGNSVLTRFLRSNSNAFAADPSTRFDFAWNDGQRFIVQPYANHKGAKLAFGPNDGYLYIGFGDGGSGGDPQNRAQNMGLLFGKMLRLDVNVPLGDPKGYRIPPNNPFVDGHLPGALGEIWDVGLRNPWRFSFDDPTKGGTGALVIGDVGQDSYEEVDYEPAGAGGRNYGWSLMEGTHPFNLSKTPAFTPLTNPIFDYGRSTGGCTIGGHVFRGQSLGLTFLGQYIFADFLLKRLFSVQLTVDPSTHEATAGPLVEHTAEVGGSGAIGPVASIDADRYGDLYLVSYGGKISKLAIPDADGDGLPTDWELQFGLDPNSAVGDNGANGDPNHNGITNLQEFQNGTHPTANALFNRYFAEGSNNAFFNTTIDLANPGMLDARVLLHFLRTDGAVVNYFVYIPALRHVTVATSQIPGVQVADFSTVIETDREIVAERTMVWPPDQQYGSHTETALKAPSTDWFLAEGATHGNFSLFYLLENPSTTAAQVQIRYILPASAPIALNYAVAPHSRRTIPVNNEPGLGATDVSAAIHSNVPVIAERAMYFSRPGQPFAGGHNSAGVTGPNKHWFFAEGATGNFFNDFMLVANPDQALTANVTISYLLVDGTVVPVHHIVAPNSRQTYNVALEAPAVASAAFSAVVDSDVPIVAERSMYWPLDWTEAHNSPGAIETGTAWVVAGGEGGGPFGAQTYVLIANTSSFAGVAHVSVLQEGGAPLVKDFPLPPKSRTNVPVGSIPEFSAVASAHYGVLIESLGATPAQIVVERATYSNDSSGNVWAAGAAALGTKIR